LVLVLLFTNFLSSIFLFLTFLFLHQVNSISDRSDSNPALNEVSEMALTSFALAFSLAYLE